MPNAEHRATRAPLAVALLVVIGIVAAACGSSATSSPDSGAAVTTAAPSALPAGTYSSTAFQPAVTYTLPAGWDNPADAADFFQLRPAGSEVAGIYLFRDPDPASQEESCPEAAEPGVGTSAVELATWIRSLPGLVVSDPVPVTVGGLTGVGLDLGIVDGWTASCPFANGLPTVPLFVGSNGTYRWVVAGTEQLRLALLDVPGGGTVVVDIDAFEGGIIDDLLAAADPIVKSFQFAPLQPAP